MNLHITTPFGRRSLSAAQIKAQAAAAGCSDETTVNKWTVFRDIAAARGLYGLSDRALVVLNALLTFHPETALTAGEGTGLVVFPSNAALALRANGIAEPTLRRHLAALVEAGVVIRRDSPNGKRYARRGHDGEIAQSYGFDLAPVVARAAEFAADAAGVRAAALALRVARGQSTVLRRDCTKLILALEEAENAPGAAVTLRSRYRSIVAALPRMPTIEDLAAANHDLAALAADVGKLLLTHHESAESSANAAQNERHIQSSNPEAPVSEPASRIVQKESSDHDPRRGGEVRTTVRPASDVYSIGQVLEACPDIVEFAREGIRSWRDLVETANLARSGLGISPNAWRDAQDVMGPETAAATVAAILQRAEHIKSPGGYLRSLVERKKMGQFSLRPVLQALTRAQLDARHKRG
ncbi:MAG: plasmid replication protein RepC [Microvirga sp.]